MSATGEVDSMAVQEPPQASPSPPPTLRPTDNYDNTTLLRLSDASNDALLTSQSNPLTTITSNNVLAAVGPSASITRASSLPCSLSPETERGQTPSPLPGQDTFSPTPHSPPIATITQSDSNTSTQREHKSTTTGTRASKGRTSTSAPHSLSRNERAQTTTVSPSSSRASSHTRQDITNTTSSGARQLSSAVAAVYKRALVAANKHSSNNATSSTLRRSVHTAANTSTSKSDTAASRSPQRAGTNTTKTATAASASATCHSAQEETKEVSRSTCSTSPSTHHALSHTLAGNAEDERVVEEEQASTSASLKSRMDEPRMTHTTSHASGHPTTQTDKYSTRNTSKSTPPLGASGSLATSTPDSARTSHSLTSVTTNHSGSVASSRNSVVWYSLLLRFKGLLDRQEAVLERVSRLNAVRVRSDGTLEPGSSEALANITALSNATPQTVSFSTSASSPSLSLLVPQKSNETQSFSPSNITHISLHDAGYLLAAHARPTASPATQHVLAQRVLSEAETRAATRLLHAHHSRKGDTHDDRSSRPQAEPMASLDITANALCPKGMEQVGGVDCMKRESSVVVVRPVLDEKCTCTTTTTATSTLRDVRHTGEDDDGSAQAMCEQSPILLVRRTASPAPHRATSDALPHTPRVECHTEEEPNDPNERISLTRMDMSAGKPPALQPVFDCADTALEAESSSAMLALEGTVQQSRQYKASINSAIRGKDTTTIAESINLTSTASSGANNTCETQETMRGLALHHGSSNVYNQLMTGTVNSGVPNKTSEAHHESEDEMMNLTGDPGLASRTNSMLHFTLQPCPSYASNTTTTLYGGVNGGSFASATISPLSQPMSSRNEYLNVSLNNNVNSAMAGVNTSAGGTPAMLRGFSSVYYYATSPSSAAATNPSMTPRQLISPAANATSTLTNASVSSASNTLTTTNAANNNATPAKASFLARVTLSPAPITATDNVQPCNDTSGTTASTTAQAALSKSDTRPPHVLPSTSNGVNSTEIVDAASTSSASPSASSVEENTRPTKEEEVQSNPAHTTTTTTDIFTRPKSWPAPPIPTMRRPPIVPHGTNTTTLASPKHTAATTHTTADDERLLDEAHMHSATSEQNGVRYASTTAHNVSSLSVQGQSHEKDMPGMAFNTTADVITSQIHSEEVKSPAVDAAELRRSDSWRAFELRHGQEHLPPAWLAPSVHVKSSDKKTRNTSHDAEQEEGEEEEKEIQRVRAVRAAPATLLTETHSFHSDSEIYSSSYSTRSNSSNSSEDDEEGSEVQRRRRHNASLSAEVHTHTSYAGTSVAAVSASLAAALLSGFSVHSHRYAPRRNATGQRRNASTSTSTGHVSEATCMEGQNNDSNTLKVHDTASAALPSSQQGGGGVSSLAVSEKPQSNTSAPSAAPEEVTAARSHDEDEEEGEAGLYDLNNSLRELSRVEAQNIIALSARPLRRPRRARRMPGRRQLRDWPTATAVLTPTSLSKTNNREAEADIEAEGEASNASVVEEKNTTIVSVPARVNSRDDVPRLTDSPLPPTRTDRADTIDEETPLRCLKNDEARHSPVPTTSSSSTSPSMSRTPSVLSMSGSRKAHKKDDRLHVAARESLSTPRTSLVQTTASLSGADEVCQVMRYAIKGQRTPTVVGKHGDETNILMCSTQSRAEYHDDEYERDEEGGELQQSREYASVEVMRRDTNSYTEAELQDTVRSVNDRVTIGRVLVSSSISSSGTRDVQEDIVRVTSVAPTLVTSQSYTEEKNNKDEAIIPHTLSPQANDEREIKEADVPSPLPPAPLSTPNTHNITTTAREGRNSSSPSHASTPFSSRDRSNHSNSSENTPHRSHAQRARTPRFRFLHTPRGTSRPNALGHPARSKAIASVVAAAVAASANSPLPTSTHNNNSNKNTRTKETTIISSSCHERRMNKTTQPHLTLVDFMNDNNNENDTSEDVVGLSAVLARDLSAMEKTLHTRPEGHFAQPVHPLVSQLQRPLRLPRRRRWEKRSGSTTPTHTAVQQHNPHRRRRGERILRQDASHAAASSWTSIPRERHAVHVRTATYTSVNTNSSTSKEVETHVPPTTSNTTTHVPTHTAPVTTTTNTSTTISNVTHAQAHTAASWYKRRGKYGVGATERPAEAAEEVKAPTNVLGVVSSKAHLTNTVKASQPLHPHCPGHRVRRTDHMHSTHTKETEQVIPAQHLESVRTQPRVTVNAEGHTAGARQANANDLSTQEESRTSVSELPSVVRELFVCPPSAEQAPHVDNRGAKHSSLQRTRLTRDASDNTVKATPPNAGSNYKEESSEKRDISHNTTIVQNNVNEAQVGDINITAAEEEPSMTLRSESRPSSVLPVVNADISLTSISTAAIAPTTLPRGSGCNDPGSESTVNITTDMHNEEVNKAAVDEKESLARSESQRDKRGSQGSDTTTTHRSNQETTTTITTTTAGNERQQLQNCTRRRYVQEGTTSRMRTARTAQSNTHLEASNNNTTNNNNTSVVSLAPLSHNTSSASSMSHMGGGNNTNPTSVHQRESGEGKHYVVPSQPYTASSNAVCDTITVHRPANTSATTTTGNSITLVHVTTHRVRGDNTIAAPLTRNAASPLRSVSASARDLLTSAAIPASEMRNETTRQANARAQMTASPSWGRIFTTTTTTSAMNKSAFFSNTLLSQYNSTTSNSVSVTARASTVLPQRNVSPIRFPSALGTRRDGQGSPPHRRRVALVPNTATVNTTTATAIKNESAGCVGHVLNEAGQVPRQHVEMPAAAGVATGATSKSVRPACV